MNGTKRYFTLFRYSEIARQVLCQKLFLIKNPPHDHERIGTIANNLSEGKRFKALGAVGEQQYERTVATRDFNYAAAEFACH